MFLSKTSTEAFKTPELSPGFQVAAACQATGQTGTQLLSGSQW